MSANPPKLRRDKQDGPSSVQYHVSIVLTSVVRRENNKSVTMTSHRIDNTLHNKNKERETCRLNIFFYFYFLVREKKVSRLLG